jgi:hypothetical protein
VSARHPEDGPSVETECCDLSGCYSPWAWEAERRNGPRRLRLCESHADLWLKSEREFLAELESVAGRPASPGTAKAIRTRYGRVGT